MKAAKNDVTGDKIITDPPTSRYIDGYAQIDWNTSSKAKAKQEEDETLSEKIRQARYGAVANPYQGSDKKVLFVCSMGILRSATGARIYARKYNTRCAGTHAEALVPVTKLLLNWADQIVFVHQKNYDALVQEYFATDFLFELQEKSVVLNIPDVYEHMHPQIIKSFNEQFEPIGE
jgi:predicted protein tyrosine phosphatase